MTIKRQTTSERPSEQSDESQVVRQWRLLNILGQQESGADLRTLAAQLNTSQRTIQRDIDDLQDAGFPLKSKRGPHGRKYWVRVAGQIPSISLNPGQVAALYISRRLLEPLAGTVLWKDAQEAFQRFEYTFDKKMLKYLDKLAQTFHATKFGTRDYSNYGQILDDLMVAIEDRQRVAIAYQSLQTTEPTDRDVYPLQIVFHKGALYLIGYSVEQKEFRNYKVDRISDVYFKRDSLPFNATDFDLKQWLAGSFGIYHGSMSKPTKVVIRFAPSVVRYVEEKTWHATEKVQPQPDGSLLVTFVLTDFHEVKTWILSFGPTARVLEPPELVEEIRRDLQETLRSYASGPSLEARSDLPPSGTNVTPFKRGQR